MADEELDDVNVDEEDGGEETPPPKPAPKPVKPAAKVQVTKPIPATERPIPEDSEERREELINARKALVERNRENQKLRARLDEIERRETERTEALLPEQEKTKRELVNAKARLTELESELATAKQQRITARIDYEIERQAVTLFQNPELALRLVDRNLIDIDEETDKVTGIKEALFAVIKAYPDLGKEKSARGGSPPERSWRNGNGHDPKGARPPKESEQMPIGQDLERHIGGY